MRLGRIVVAGSLAALVLALAACGDIFRPIVNPITPPGGDPQAFRLALVVNEGGTPGTTTQINVSGDTNAGNFVMGQAPVHATFAGVSGAFVANRDSDTVSAYVPSQQASQVRTVTLPAGSKPVFVHTTETSTNGNCLSGANARAACLYVANSGSNKVGVIDSVQLVLRDEVVVGNSPVALVETPDVKKLYALNKGSGSISVITTSDMQANTTIAVGASPVWAVMRPDGARLFVVNQGSSTVSVIDTASDTVINTLNTGASPTHAFYDDRLKRLWVVNTGAGTVSVFGTDVEPNPLLAEIPVGAAPRAVVALADGSRAYVANSGAGTVSVVDQVSLKATKTIAVGSAPVWVAASPDSTKVFVANRDSNSVSDIRTSDDTVVRTIDTGSPNPVFITVSP